MERVSIGVIFIRSPVLCRCSISSGIHFAPIETICSLSRIDLGKDTQQRICVTHTRRIVIQAACGELKNVLSNLTKQAASTDPAAKSPSPFSHMNLFRHAQKTSEPPFFALSHRYLCRCCDRKIYSEENLDVRLISHSLSSVRSTRRSLNLFVA